MILHNVITVLKSSYIFIVAKAKWRHYDNKLFNTLDELTYKILSTKNAKWIVKYYKNLK